MNEDLTAVVGAAARFAATLLFAAVMAIGLAGCEDEGPMEQTGESIDEAGEETGEAAEDATDEAEDAFE